MLCHPEDVESSAKRRTPDEGPVYLAASMPLSANTQVLRPANYAVLRMTIFRWIARGQAFYATFLGEAGGTGSLAASVDAEGERGAAKAGSGTTAGGGIISKAAP